MFDLLAQAGDVPSDNQAISWFAISAVVLGLGLIISMFFNRKK